MTESRPLGFRESSFCLIQELYRGDSNCVGAITIDGRLNEQKLLNAVHVIIKRQPLLRCIWKKQSMTFECADELTSDIPVTFHTNEPINSWEACFNQRLAEHYSEGALLWSLDVFINNDHKHQLVFCTSHFNGDGASILHFFNDLFLTYDSKLDKQEYPFYSNVEDYMQHLATSKPAEAIDAPTLWKYDKNIVLSIRTTKHRFLTFNKQQTDSLVKFCRTNSITVNSFFNAAVLIATARLLSKDINLMLFTPVNLRSLCKPKIPEDYFGTYVQSLITQHKDISPQADIVTIAKQYQKQMRAKFKTDIANPIQFNTNEIKDSILSMNLDAIDYFPTGISVSNMGRLSFSTEYNDFSWKSINVSASTISGMIPFILAMVTMNDELHATLIYPAELISEETCDKFVSSIIELSQNDL